MSRFAIFTFRSSAPVESMDGELPGADDPPTAERGSSIVAVLVALSIGLAATGVLVMLSVAEVRLAAADRDTLEVRYAAEAALDRAVVDLQQLSSWNDVLAGLPGSSFAVGPRALLVPGRPLIDLEAEGARMQAATDAASSAGADTPRWRLFGWGPFSAVLPHNVDLRSPVAVAVWVADDEAEHDGAPQLDGNQTVWLRAVAYGPGTSGRTIDALLTRDAAAPSPLRRLVWRAAGQD